MTAPIHVLPSAAPTPPVMDVGYFDGDVMIALSPAMARDLAAIWSQAHIADPILEQTRPRFLDDVDALIKNAALAERQIVATPDPVLVPVLALVPMTDKAVRS